MYKKHAKNSFFICIGTYLHCNNCIPKGRAMRLFSHKRSMRVSEVHSEKRTRKHKDVQKHRDKQAPSTRSSGQLHLNTQQRYHTHRPTLSLLHLLRSYNNDL
ncbi:hypothetical protein JOB18_024992 [Solea senegalensis]|uniref:Uncharacterized protein n=1 Tax=Solea senegalensis TaxID=28829 RepID=A0AAV6SFM5_SOLSE|nr:hypothetical protein JOB18_024992 [Solea senegalensis]